MTNKKSSPTWGGKRPNTGGSRKGAGRTRMLENELANESIRYSITPSKKKEMEMFKMNKESIHQLSRRSTEKAIENLFYTCKKAPWPMFFRQVLPCPTDELRAMMRCLPNHEDDWYWLLPGEDRYFPGSSDGFYPMRFVEKDTIRLQNGIPVALQTSTHAHYLERTDFKTDGSRKGVVWMDRPMLYSIGTHTLEAFHLERITPSRLEENYSHSLRTGQFVRFEDTRVWKITEISPVEANGCVYITCELLSKKDFETLAKPKDALLG